MDAERSQRAQVFGSLLVALAIVAVVIVAVTARLGPTSVAELEAREDAREQRIEAVEERREQAQEAHEEELDGD
jgi:type II secretory pathway pseudopilin PulG